MRSQGKLRYVFDKVLTCLDVFVEAECCTVIHHPRLIFLVADMFGTLNRAEDAPALLPHAQQARRNLETHENMGYIKCSFALLS